MSNEKPCPSVSAISKTYDAGDAMAAIREARRLAQDENASQEERDEASAFLVQVSGASNVARVTGGIALAVVAFILMAIYVF